MFSLNIKIDDHTIESSYIIFQSPINALEALITHVQGQRSYFEDLIKNEDRWLLDESIEEIVLRIINGKDSIIGFADQDYDEDNTGAILNLSVHDDKTVGFHYHNGDDEYIDIYTEVIDFNEMHTIA